MRSIFSSNNFKLLQLLWTSDGSLVPTSNSNLKHPYLCSNVNNHLRCRFYRKFPNQGEFNESESTSPCFGYSFGCFVLIFPAPTYPIVYAFSFLKVLHPACQCVPFKFKCWPSCPQSERRRFWVVQDYYFFLSQRFVS